MTFFDTGEKKSPADQGILSGFSASWLNISNSFFTSLSLLQCIF